MFSKILVANRGEIAVRIIRACKEMGIETVAVYSTEDKDLLHVALADESFCIGSSPADDSYLNKERIISTALISGAQAVHPGYGFLSENADFALACQNNGLVFIGPGAETMLKISNKVQIKKIVAETALHPIPGSDVLLSEKEAVDAAGRIGFPVMLKASSGGGGRGIRLLRSPEDVRQNYDLAVSESESAFGDGSVYLEKYISPAHHIEMQIMADEQGNVVCLGERDCSIQRRHQKLVEESPSPAVDSEQRRKLIENVTEAIKRIGYAGIGTMEFLLDQNGDFWFMEMNVRLQVEHPVTEMLTNMDIVKWQIRIAAGIPLRFRQKDICVKGAAIECRISALAPGKLGMFHIPGGPFVRFDTYLVSGVQIGPYYDSLIGKLVVYAGTREEAVRKMKAALCEFVIEGIPTNIEEQLRIISKEQFSDGTYDLTLIESG